MSFTLTSYILICIVHNRLLWRWYIKIAWWISIINTSPVMDQSYATATKTVLQFVVVIHFEVSYPKTFTGWLKYYTISACWLMTHVSEWVFRSVHWYPSYVRTELTRMVLTTEVTYHPWRILCLFNAGLYYLVWGEIPLVPLVLISWQPPVRIPASSARILRHPLFKLTFFSAGLFPPACLLF